MCCEADSVGDGWQKRRTPECGSDCSGTLVKFCLVRGEGRGMYAKKCALYLAQNNKFMYYSCVQWHIFVCRGMLMCHCVNWRGKMIALTTATGLYVLSCIRACLPTVVSTELANSNLVKVADFYPGVLNTP